MPASYSGRRFVILAGLAVLVIWGMRDTALLPSQLDLADYVPELTIEKVDAGHFVPWEKPDAVIAAMRRWGI